MKIYHQQTYNSILILNMKNRTALVEYDMFV